MKNHNMTQNAWQFNAKYTVISIKRHNNLRQIVL